MNNNIPYIMKSAIEAEKQKNYDVALQMYKDILSLDHHYYDAWLNAGVIYSKQKKPNKAIYCFQQSIKKQEDARSYYNISIEFFKLNNFEKAKENIIHVIRLNPNLINAHLLLGQIYSKLNTFDLAENAVSKVLTIEPRNQTAILGLISINFTLKRHKKVAQYLKLFIDIGGNQIVAEKIKAKLYLETGNIAYSISTFKKVATIDKESLQLKEVFKQKISNNSKVKLLNKAKIINSKATKEKTDWLDLSILSLFQGNFTEAMDQLSKAVPTNINSK